LAAQDGNLVAEHDDLDDQVLLPTTGQAEQLEEANERNVQKGERHDHIFGIGVPSRKSWSTGPDDVFGIYRVPRRRRKAPGTPVLRVIPLRLFC
jgi:hypothetical protein